MANPSKITLRTVAEKAGVSVATVSYAMRGSRKIPADTRQMIATVAQKLGYRPNARVAELMAHIRTGRRGAEDGLALVWLDTSRPKGPSWFNAQISGGAKARAEQRGYRLTEYWLDEVDNRADRLAGILRARGCAGVLFAPVMRHERMDIDWPWDWFATAQLGMADWPVGLSRAGHHHYEAMRMTIGKLPSGVAGKTAALIAASTDERAHRGWSAAWLAFAGKCAGRRMMRYGKLPADAIAAFLQRISPECLIVDNLGIFDAVKKAGWPVSARNTVMLDRLPSMGLSGVEQGYDEIAAQGVDLVTAQLHRNERGLPETPRALLFPGRWRAAEG